MQNPLLVLWTFVFSAEKVLVAIPKDKKENIFFFKELAEKGHLRVIVDKTYSLEQIVEAYRYVVTGQKTGSLLIKISD